MDMDSPSDPGPRNPSGWSVRRPGALTAAALLLFLTSYVSGLIPILLRRTLTRAWYLQPPLWLLIGAAVALAGALFASLREAKAQPSHAPGAGQLPTWAYWWSIGVGLVVSFFSTMVDNALLERPGHSRFVFLLVGWVAPGPVTYGFLAVRFRTSIHALLAALIAVASSFFAWAILLFLLPLVVFGGP